MELGLKIQKAINKNKEHYNAWLQKSKDIEIENNSFKLFDNVSWEDEKQGELKEVFRDGKLFRPANLPIQNEK
jgi:hypothetical protein